MHKKNWLFMMFTLLPFFTSCSETGSSEEELSEPEFLEHEEQQQARETAQNLLQPYNTTVDQVAQAKRLSEQTVINALMWISEHPATPMPSTPLDFTADDINQAAQQFISARTDRREYMAKYRAANKEKFEQLKKQEIMKKEGVSQEDIDDAFKYYSWSPYGQLPDNKKRIEELAAAYRKGLDSHKGYRAASKEKFEQLNKQEIMQREGVSQEDIDDAFKHYYSHPYGQLPDNKKRIEELAAAYRKGLEGYKVYRAAHLEKIKESKKRKVEEILEKQEKAAKGIARIDMDQLARNTGLTAKEILAALNRYKQLDTSEPFPEEREPLMDLARQWSEQAGKRKKQRSAKIAARAKRKY